MFKFIKRLLLIAALCMPWVTQAQSDSCTFKIVGEDAYADGWNGGSLAVMQGTTTVATFDAANADNDGDGPALDSTFVTLASDAPVSFVWTSGSYGDEVTIWIYNASGVLLYTVNDPSAGTLFSMSSPCSNCFAPSGLTVDSLTSDFARLVWNGDADGYGIIWGESADVLAGNGTATSTTDTYYDLSNLTSGTSYTVLVWTECDNSETSDTISITFVTVGDAVSEFPYTTGFEATDDIAWNFVNDATNKWFIGTPGAHSGTSGLFVSNDNGSSLAYNVSGIQFSYAYRVLSFTDSAQLAISFDWKANGESNYDYLRAWIAPATAINSLQAGHDPEGGTSAYSYTNSTPAGWVDLGGKMNLQSGWQTCVATPSVGAGDYMLVFMWANDVSGGSMPPAAVDNIYINQLSCPAPTAFTASAINSEGFTLNWTAGGNENEWMVTLNDSVLGVVSTNTYTVTDLLANTLYTARVYAICGAGDTSMATSIPVRTACGDITVLPVTYNFDDQATGSSADFAYCWTRYNNDVDYNYYPYITSNATYAHSGNNCLYTYLYTSASYPDTILTILPPIDSTEYQIGNLEVLFWGATSSSSYHPIFEVGVYVENDDTTYFQPLDTVSVLYSNGLAEYSTQFTGYEGPHGRIAFRYLKSMMCATYSYCYLYMDDVTIREVNDCAIPAQFSVNAANADSVMVMWQEVGEATSWQLVYGVDGFNPDTVDESNIIVATDTVYWIENIPSGITYQVYVRSECGDGTSYWAGPLSFTPGSINMGITGSSTIYACNAVIYDDGGATGDYSNNCHYTLTIYPNDDTKRFKFWASGVTEGTIDYLRVYAGTAASGTMLGQINNSNPTIDTVTTQGGPITLLFHSDVSIVYSGFEFHLVCEDLPSCRDIDEVTIQEVSTSSAYITWTNAIGSTPLPNSYIVTVYDTANSVAATVTTPDMFAMVGGLNAGSDYTVSVVPSCDDSDGMPAMVSFTTAGFGCMQVDDALSFSDTIGNGTSTSTYLPSYSFYNYGLTQQIYTATEIGHGGQIDNVSFMWSAVAQQRTYEIYMGHYSAATASNYVHPSDLTLVYNGGPVTLTANQWTTFTLTTPFNYNGSDNLVVILRDMTGSYVSGNSGYVHSAPDGSARYAYQDSGPYDPFTYSGGTSLSVRNNIILGGAPCAVEFSCAAPLVVVTGKTSTTVDLMWAAGADETSWNVEHKAVNDASWTVDYAGTSITSATISGLTPYTEYQIRVYHLCGTDTFATVKTVLTDCVGEPVPFSENFSTWTTGSTAPAPSCWFKLSDYSAGYPYISTSYSLGDGKSMYFYASGTTHTALILPKMDAPIDTLLLSGFVYYSSNDYQLDLGVITDVTDFSTFHAVGSVSTVANTWVPFEVSFVGQPEGNIALSAGNNGSYVYLYLDNIEVNYMNPCIRPTNVTASGITQTSANISWMDTATNNFVVEYGPAGFEHGTGTVISVTGNTTQLTGLTHSTMYEVYVRGICGDSDSSNWSFAYRFATTCGTINSLPKTETFSSWGTGSSVHAPYCWSYGSTYSSTYPYINGSYNHSGTTGGAMYMYNSSSSGAYDTYFSLPELDSIYSASDLQVYFYAYNPTSTATYVADVIVGVCTTPGNISTFVAVDTITLNYEGANAWRPYEVAFDSYTGNGRYITFLAKPSTGSTYCYPVIDDITLELIPTCQRPNDLTATNATTNTVDLAWNDRANASQWQIEYGPTGFQQGTGTTVIANSNPFTLTGLPASYQGEYYVRAICSATDTGDYSRDACGFNTTQAPATLPYSYNFEDPAEWANWQHSTNNPSYDWYRGTAANTNGNTSQYSMYVSADSGVTYRPYVNDAVVNAAVYRDVDFGPNQSSFTVTFDARAGGTIDARYDALMVFLVDPAIPTIPSNSGITSPWGNVNDLYRIATIYLDTNWNTYSASFDTVSGIRRVAFFWFNQSTSSYDTYPEAAAVDNIHIEESACPRPVATTLNYASSTSASLSWIGPSPANYEVIYRPYPGTPAQNVFLQTQTNSITLTGLEPMSEYVVWVRKLCTNDTSLTSDAYHFVTEMCDNPTFAYNYDSTMTSTTTSQYAPIGYSTYNYSYVQTIIDSAFMAEMQGDITAFAFNVSTASAGDYFTGMNVYMANVSESSLSGFLTPDSAHQFVEVIHNGDFTFTTTGWQLFGFDSTFTWDGHSNVLFAVNRNHGSWSSGAYFHAHNTTGASKTYYAYQDSGPISITSPSADYGNTTLAYTGDIMLVSCGAGCRVPGALSATNISYNGATLNWGGSAMDYEVAVKAANEATWPEAVAVSNATSYAVTGLAPTTQYQFRVRAICDATEELISDWAVGNFITDSLPCFDPSGLEATATTFTTATLDWEANGAENQWSIHVWNNTFNQEYTADAHPFTVTGLDQTLTYNAAVKAICGNGAAESEYSDTIQFTTATCEQVTGVTATATNSTTATVNWTAASTTSYQIDYGPRGHGQGSGTIVNVDANNYTITGLSPETAYSVYVRAVCEPGVYGLWSTAVEFTTSGEGIDLADGIGLNIYPNPTSSTTTIALSGVNGTVSVSIVDMNGRVVMSDSMSCEGDCVKTMEVSGLAQGAYFVRISGENVNMVKKLVVK